MHKFVIAKSGVVRSGIMGGCLVLMGFFGGCAKYTPKPLHAPFGIAQEKGNVSMTASRLSDLDCSYYFSRKIIAKGYQPIQLVVQNKSDRTLFLDAQDISLEVEKVSSVAKSLHLNTAKRVVLWCIPALFIWPFVIPAVVEGFSSSDANKRLDRDFRERAFDAHSIITIPPYSFINKVFFVATGNYRQSFNVTLTDRHGSESIFAVNL